MSNISKFIVELIGTFFFISVILSTINNKISLGPLAPISIVVALLAVIYFGGSISGGHFNPAVSISMFLKNQINFTLLIGYIIFQIIGGCLAVVFNNFIYL